jgi:dihydropyrimidinase
MPTGVPRRCLCEDGKITAVGDRTWPRPGRRQTVDAGGQYVMPGGIDPHTHMQLPFMGTVTRGRLLHRHRGRRWPVAPPAIIDFVIPNPQQPLMEAYQQVARLGREGGRRLQLPRRRHLVGRDSVHRDMGTLVQRGGREQLQALHGLQERHHVRRRDAGEQLQARMELGAMPTVHAENGELVYLLQQSEARWASPGPRAIRCRARRRRRRSRQPRHRHCRRAERADLRGACELHRSAEAIARARARGQRVYGEVLAGHLVVDDSVYRNPDFAYAAAHVMSPPFRPKGNQEFLWRGLQAGSLHTTATDHCTFCAAQKAAGKDDFSQDPQRLRRRGRAPGRDVGRGREHGQADAQRVRRHHLGQHRQAVQHLPAQGLRRPRRRCRHGGVGPAGTKTLSAKTQHSKGDFNIFEGRTVQGIPSHTLSQGTLVYVQGDLRAVQGARGATSSGRRLAPTSRRKRAQSPLPVAPGGPITRRSAYSMDMNPMRAPPPCQ